MKFCWYYFRHFLISGATFSLLSVSSSFASGMSKEIEKKELVDEENSQNIMQPPQSPNSPRAQRKVRQKRCHTVHPDMLEPFALNFPISVQDITRALEQLKLMEDGNMQEEAKLRDFSKPISSAPIHPDMPEPVSSDSQMSVNDIALGLEKLKLVAEEDVKLLDFSKPISSAQLFFNFGELPRKLTKHIAKFKDLYVRKHRKIIGKFVERVEYYAKENLLLRAENADLIDDLRGLAKDYEMMHVYEQEKDPHKKDAYLQNITILHNDLSSGIAPRGSRFRNQWLAFEVMKEEAWDYIQMGYEKFSETEQKGSKVIHLTIDMVIPFYTFLKDNMTLIAALENEREAFYHLLHRHGGITKKTVQFEQAIDEFPSYIGRLREAADEAEKREAAELAQQAALHQQPQASPRDMDVDKKRKSSPRRVILSLDLTKTKSTPRKISAGEGSPNHSKSGHASPVAAQKLTLSVNDVPQVVERKRSNPSASKSPRKLDSGPDDLSQVVHSSDEPMKTKPTPRKISGGQGSPNHSKSGHASPVALQKLTLSMNDVPQVTERKRSNSLTGKLPSGSDEGSGDLSGAQAAEQDTTSAHRKLSIFHQLSFRRTDDK